MSRLLDRQQCLDASPFRKAEVRGALEWELRYGAGRRRTHLAGREVGKGEGGHAGYSPGRAEARDGEGVGCRLPVDVQRHDPAALVTGRELPDAADVWD